MDVDIKEIAERTRIIAMVGASSNPDRPSYGVMRYLQDHGYRVIPINPGIAGKTVNGEMTYESLASLPSELKNKIDMVDIFRNSADAAKPALEAIDIGARYVWMQLGVINEDAAKKCRAAGLMVVMNKCPAIEFPKLIEQRTND